MPTTIVTDLGRNRMQSDGVTITGVMCKTVAANNPVVIELQRADFTGTTVLSAWDGVNLSINLGSLASEVSVGDYLYNGTSGRKLVLNKTGNVVTFDFPFAALGNITTYFNIERRLNWYLVVEVKQSSNSKRYVRFTPDEEGLIRAEISGALKSMVNLNDTENSTIANSVSQSLTFTINWTEYWVGSTESITTNTDKYFAINGAFQICDPNDGYYIDYFANLFGSSSFPLLLPKWLTEFERPTQFGGFPFTCSMLFNEGLGSMTGYSVDKIYKDAAGSVITYEDYPLPLGDNDAILQILLTKGGIEVTDPDLARTLTVLFYRESDYLDIIRPLYCNYIPVNMQDCNSFYVKWINTLGGWDYWLFQGNIYETDRVETGGSYESYFDSIASASDFENWVSKQATPQVQVGCDVANEGDARGLRSLKSSPKVYWYNTAISKWIGVKVDPGSFAFRKNRSSYNRVELTINLPRTFNQTA